MPRDTHDDGVAAFFGTITSKPAREALRELDPSLQNSGFSYHSPIVRMRQLLDLYTCLRPRKAFRGNPLKYCDDVDVVVFRENTEGMYIGVEFSQAPACFFEEPSMQRIPRDAAISSPLRAGSRCRPQPIPAAR